MLFVNTAQLYLLTVGEKHRKIVLITLNNQDSLKLVGGDQ